MGIYIKGINVPKDCDSCDIVKDCPLWYCTDIGARHPECPITEVKEPHGRLIDADVFIQRNAEIIDCKIDHPKYEDTLRELIDGQPTIIERSEDDKP